MTSTSMPPEYPLPQNESFPLHTTQLPVCRLHKALFSIQPSWSLAYICESAESCISWLLALRFDPRPVSDSCSDMWMFIDLGYFSDFVKTFLHMDSYTLPVTTTTTDSYNSMPHYSVTKSSRSNIFTDMFQLMTEWNQFLSSSGGTKDESVQILHLNT